MAMCALIVEDNELNYKLMRDLLEASGFETVHAAKGKAALDLARKYKPDCIVMDIQLPDISGLEVTRQIRADSELGRVPIIAVTASVLGCAKDEAFEAGCDAYISKPISVTNFLRDVKRTMR